MKKIIYILTILFLFISNTYTQTPFFDDANSFFKKNVIEGKINYSEIYNNTKELYNLLDYLATNNIPENDKKAYLINAYNIFVIANVIELYPIASPNASASFFDGKNSALAGSKISLNELEKDLILKPFSDPRLHFALVCGAVSCPPIINRAYRTEQLDQQLDIQIIDALNSDFIKINSASNTVLLSQIFKWFSADFGKNEKEIIKFINQYRELKIDLNSKVNYYDYNWALNDNKIPVANSTIQKTSLQLFTAGSLLGKNKFDFTSFNTLYTESKSNWLAQNNSGFRKTFVTHLVQITYGVSKNKRVNIGLDLNFKYSGSSTDSAFSGISEAFKFKNTPTSRVGLTSAGVRIKLQPFKSVADFSIQSTIIAPTVKFAEGNTNLYWADWERITWWNQFFYTKTINKFQLFTEIDLLFRFKIYKNQISMLDIPMSVFLSYFPTNKITFYIMNQHVPRFTNNINQTATDWVIPSNYTASGIGGKYQVSSNLNFEVLYTNFWRANNAGFGNTFNFGVKYLTK